MNIVEAICGICLAFIAWNFADNIIAGVVAQQAGAATHQEGNNG